MNSKILVSLILLVLFSGCVQEQKLSEQELEEKAKECFYNMDEITFESFNFYKVNSTDFYVTQKTSAHSTQYSNWENVCVNCAINNEAIGLCKENIEKCKSFNGNIHIYEFSLNENIQVPREIEIYEAKAVLNDNGEPIGCYTSSFINTYQ